MGCGLRKPAADLLTSTQLHQLSSPLSTPQSRYSRPKGNMKLLSLPVEIILMIVDRTDTSDLIPIAATCKAMCQILAQNKYFPKLCHLTTLPLSRSAFFFLVNQNLTHVKKILAALPSLSHLHLSKLLHDTNRPLGVAELWFCNNFENLRILTIDNHFDYPTVKISLYPHPKMSRYPNPRRKAVQLLRSVKSLRLTYCVANEEARRFRASYGESWWQMFPELEELDLRLLHDGRSVGPQRLHGLFSELEELSSLQALRLCLRFNSRDDGEHWSVDWFNFRRFNSLKYLAFDFSMLNPVSGFYSWPKSNGAQPRLWRAAAQNPQTKLDINRGITELAGILPRSIESLVIHHLPADEGPDHSPFFKLICLGLAERRETYFPMLRGVELWHAHGDFKNERQAFAFGRALKKAGVPVKSNVRIADGKPTKEALHHSVRLFWDFE